MNKINHYQSIYQLYKKHQPTAKNVYQRVANIKGISISQVKNIVRVMKFDKTQQLLLSGDVDLNRCLILLSIKNHKDFAQFALLAASKISRQHFIDCVKNSQTPDFYVLDNGNEFTHQQLESLNKQLSDIFQHKVEIAIGRDNRSLTVMVQYYFLSDILKTIEQFQLVTLKCKIQIINPSLSSEQFSEEFRRDCQLHLVFLSVTEFNVFHEKLTLSNNIEA